MTEPDGSGPEVSGNVFHGPAALQAGDHNVQVVHHHAVLTAGDVLDTAADELARVVGAQWQEEAALRRLTDPAPLPVRWRVSERKAAGRVVAATGEGAARARFGPLPGIGPTTRAGVRAGGGLAELHAVYGGLASGRLLLVGPPAAGKSATAVLLLLDALAHRAARPSAADRARVPVPVLLSLDGWDPAEESATDWAADRLSRQYTLFHGRGGRARARRLLEQGRVALFLDGLDEVTGRLRGAMVSALETAPFRLVLVSRAKEAVLTAKKARLGGALALEIQPVRPADAAEYLLDRLPAAPSPAWRALTGRLLSETGPGPASAGPLADPLAAALSGPLAIALLRDVYGDDDPVDELLDTARFPTARAVENHLLDHAVAAAYTRRPGHPRPRYSARTAERTLRHIAARLTAEGTRDLRWWHVPGWTGRRPRTIAVWIVAAVVCGTPGAIMAWSLSPTLLTAVVVPLGAIAGGHEIARRLARFSVPQPLSSAGWRDIFTRRTVGSGITQWLFVGTLLCLVIPVVPLIDDTPPWWLWYLVTLPLGFSEVLVTGRGYEIVSGAPFLSLGTGRHYDPVREHYSRPSVLDTRSVGPRDVWRHHLGLRLFLGLLTGLALALYVGPIVAWSQSPLLGVMFGVTALVWTGATSGLAGNLAVATALTAVQLHYEEGTPLRLVHFLEDARRRNLLRATGPVYQFRHARLQERLARGERDTAG
ncbi:hypothetical protein PYK79_56050 [Streptomyces sp. ID05-04B]|uniref:hypothetical protein n=1 Tax=unclassified Streptomyces TaxID=2593676 RepID=UPI000D1A37D5|nr:MULTISPECIES: hypothetical protein [unclassified Streptomyces]AVV42854.1 hypothetical protein C6376_16930 [Streptomyces sp. P3]MDX5570756.1 hypothetical protein [Streptomyces sp. ID05-04B]